MHGAPGGCDECRAIARAAGESPEAAEHICLVRAEAQAHAQFQSTPPVEPAPPTEPTPQTRPSHAAPTRRTRVRPVPGGGAFWWSSDGVDPDAFTDATDAADIADAASDFDFDF